MPNWCDNALRVEGTVTKVQAFIDQNKGTDDDEPTDLDFNKAVSLPPELIGRLAFTSADEFTAEFNERFGADNAYDWHVRNWGTKWNATDVVVISGLMEDGRAYAEYTFATAWSPPDHWLRKTALLYPDLFFQLHWEEPGIAMRGTITAQDENYDETDEEMEFEDLEDDELLDEIIATGPPTTENECIKHDFQFNGKEISCTNCKKPQE